MKKTFLRLISLLCVISMLFCTVSCDEIKKFFGKDTGDGDEDDGGGNSGGGSSESGLQLIESNDPSAFGFLGWTFNALSDKELGITDLASHSVFDAEKLTAYRMGDSKSGVIDQQARVIFESSAQEMMKKLGIDYTATNKVKVGISKASIGFESKFGLGLDYQTTEKRKEVLYYYEYKALCEHYRVGNTSDCPQMLNAEFLAAVKAIDYTDQNAIKLFFDNYGTHVLTQYDKGAEMILSAAAVSTSSTQDLKKEISVSVGASVDTIQGGVPISAETAHTVQLAFSSYESNEDVDAKTYWKTIGGDSVYCSSYTGDSITIDEAGVRAWVESVSGEKGNSVLLPETTKWIAIWEVLPNTTEYSAIKQALYEYYLNASETSNTAFFSKFGTYSSLISVPAYTYTAPNGYVTRVTADSFVKNQLPVAPGSTLSFPVECEGYDVTFEIVDGGKYATTDEYGNIEILSGAVLNKTVSLNIYLDGIAASVLKLVIQKEGANFFDGGYGTEERPYLISTRSQLKGIPQFYENSFMLTESIDLNGEIWTPFKFYGVFDGRGHSIHNFKITQQSDKVGFFSELVGAAVKNVVVYDAEISIDEYLPETQENHIGMIAGYVDSESEIYNCAVVDSLINGHYARGAGQIQLWIGGIAGTTQGKISYCTVQLTCINGYTKVISLTSEEVLFNYIGGIVGKAESQTGKVISCGSYDNDIYSYSTAMSLFANKAKAVFFLGGVVGELYEGGRLDQSYYYDNTVEYEYEGNGSTRTSISDCVGMEHSENMSAGNLENSQKPSMLQIVSDMEVEVSKTEYKVGERFDTSTIDVSGIYGDGSAAGELSHYKLSGFDSSATGTVTVTITYNYYDRALTETFDIEIIS